MAEAKPCKWCEAGECWTHGQIEKPPGAGKGAAKKKALVGGGGKATGKGKVMQMMSQMASKGSGKAQIMQMMMAMMGASGAQGAKGQSTSWKSELNAAYAKHHKATAPKGAFVYDTNQAEDGFTSTLTCENFAGAHEGTGASKKAAEDAAAQAAVEAEFPDHVAKVAPAAPAAWGSMSGWMMGGEEDSANQHILPWRAQLTQAYSKVHKTVSKDSITYASEHNEAEKNYVSVVSSEKFSDSYTGEPGKSVKEGHDNAAKVAMEAEFPTEYASLAKTMPKSQKALKKVLKAQAPGQKRKREDGEEEVEVELDPKTRLNSAMGWMGRESGPITKESVVYTTTEEGGVTTGTVTINCLGGAPKTYTGEPQAGTGKADKKKAESNAAEAALTAMQVQISEAEVKHKAAKAEKEAIAKEKWKVLLAAKQEEKKLEKEAKKAKTE